jgi:hypothetical protein
MKRWLIGAAALLSVYVALAGYWLPRHLERIIPEYVATELGRKATIGTIHINPLLFRTELADFALAEADGRPIVRFRRLVVDFELSSLARWAWTFSTIALDGLELHADIAPDERFNLAELAASLPKGDGAKEKQDAPPPRLLLQHIAITDAAILFSDRSGARPRFDSVRPLALELRDLTTIPDRRGPYSLNARLPGGATLSWLGELSLRPIFSLGEIAIRGARPASLWKFFQEDLKIAEPAGTVDVDLRYNAAHAKGVTEFTVEDIHVTARDVALAHPGAKTPFFALKSAAVAGARFDLAARELRVPSIELRDGAVRAEIGADGILDLQKLTPASPPPADGPKGEPWRVKLDSVKLGGIALELSDLSREAPLALRAGAVDASLSAAIETGAAAQVTVSGFGLKVTGVSAGALAAPEPVAGLAAITLDGGSLDLRAQRVAAKRLAIDGGLVAVAREADGSVPALGLLKSRIKKESPAGKPWALALELLEIGKVKIALADRSFSPPVAYDIDPLTVTVKDFRTEGRQPIRLDSTLRVAQGGTLRVSAEAGTAFDRASVRATLERLSLKPLQPAVADRTTLALASGEVSATVQAQYRALKDRAELRTRGNASVEELLLTEAGTGERFLGWKAVHVNGISFSLAPERLDISSIVVTGLGAKVLVNKDRSVNLAQALKPQAGEPRAAEAPQGDPFPLSVERVRLERAAVDFSDLSLVLPFAAKIEEFSGDVLGLSTDRASRAVAKLEGRVDEFGLARVDGSLAPFDPKGFMDLRVAFRNVEMSPLSAYSVTFAGRRIAAGRLALDLQYRIDQGALAGDNKVELRDFTLGESVETPGALRLPLDLAVALLTDSQGRIAVAVPVRGNVNDPQFSYGHLVWQAITTVLTNIVSAPFRALFGGGEQVESIAFDPGRAVLTPPEREKLKRLAGALAERPKLKLVIEGQHGEADAGALRARDVAAAVSAQLERARPGEEPEPVNTRDARTQRALEAIFIARNSEQALAEFGAGRERDGAFYDALLARLVESAPLPAETLGKLARERTDAVAGHLESLAVPAARMSRKDTGAAEGERAKLALDAAG